MKSLVIEPRIPPEDQIAAALRDLDWVRTATVVRYIDPGNANEDIPVCYIEVIFNDGQSCKIQRVLSAYVVDPLPRAYQGRLSDFLHQYLTDSHG